MSIRGNAVCCLCGQSFQSRKALDEHDAANTQKHKLILEKGMTPDFGKSCKIENPFLNVILGPAVSSLVKDIKLQEVAKQAAAPLGDLFDEDTRWNHAAGRPSGHAGKYPAKQYGVDPQFAHLLLTE